MAIAATVGVLLTLVVSGLAPVASAGADDPLASLPILSPRTQAPTVPGAPFRPSTGRTDLVLARLSVLQELEPLREADVSLRIRQATDVTAPAIDTVDDDRVASGVGETIRILESQIAAYERELAAIEDASSYLKIDTAQFGIGFAAFPVASLRKPFFNDWGQPRSGGRSHKGTDLLAQIGVELRAIEDGTVQQISNGSLGGLSVYLLGESGSRYYYAHLDEVEALDVGERVYAGQRIGTVGDSGNARGAPHLHLQWSPTGGSDWSNPFPLLDALFGDGAAAEAVAAIDEVPSTTSALGLLDVRR